MLLPLLLSVLMPMISGQCLTATDEVRKLNNKAYEALLQGELMFSTDMLHTVTSMQQKQDENVLFSPSSVFSALLLAYFISANHTEEILKKALHLPADQDKLDILGAYTMDKYYQRLLMISSKGYQLSSANRILVAKDLKRQNCMKILFPDEIFPVNFGENPSGIVRKVNSWVAKQTRNFIENFLDEDSVTSDTQLILVNAVYFKGRWRNEFNPEDTFRGKFYLSNGSAVPTQMMSQENKFRLKDVKKLEAEVLELPYTGKDISMFVLLPTSNGASGIMQLLSRLDSDTLRDSLRATAITPAKPLSVTIPKFTEEQSLQLTKILENMGVGDIFQNSADFSTLVPSGESLAFSEAIHKAKLQLDEKGTKAAAATGLVSTRFGVDTFVVDRPFIYTIYDKTSNNPLFFGVFNSPG